MRAADSEIQHTIESDLTWISAGQTNYLWKYSPSRSEQGRVEQIGSVRSTDNEDIRAGFPSGQSVQLS